MGNSFKTKIIGKRVSGFKVDWHQVNEFLKLVVELSRKNSFIPRGVYRFKSNSESDEWIMKTLTNR